MTTPSVAPEMPTILKNGRALWLILEAAELRGLPMPFAIRAYGVDEGVTLQFWTHDEVAAWAGVLEADFDNERGNAVGEWLEVRVEVCTTDRRVES
jgi:hypothetical protein